MNRNANAVNKSGKNNSSRRNQKSVSKKPSLSFKNLSDEQKRLIAGYKENFQVRASTKKVNNANTHVIELHEKKSGVTMVLNFLATAEKPFSHTVLEAVSQERYLNGWADIRLTVDGSVNLTCNRLSLHQSMDGSCAIFAPRYEAKSSKYECFFFNPEFRLYLNDLLSKIFHDPDADTINFSTANPVATDGK